MNETNSLSVLKTETLSMTSLEIAELTGKEHYNVLADIRSILADLESDRLQTCKTRSLT